MSFYPELAADIERATQLVALETIRQTGCNSWQLFDPEGPTVCNCELLVNWSCSCDTQSELDFWYFWDAGWQPLCKHIVAVSLYRMASAHDDATQTQPAREFDPARAYEQVSAVIQAHIDSGDTQHLGGLHWAAGMLAAEARRRDVA